MATQENINLAQEMYVAYYGRPADSGGLAFWAQKFEDSTNLDDALADFGNSAEFTASFGGLSNTALIEGIYQQLFGHAADAGGLAFYLDRLDTGAATLASIAKQIADGASGTDQTALDNKVTVANTFTTTVEEAGSTYSGAADIAEAQAILNAVSDDAATVTSGNAAAENVADGVTLTADTATAAAGVTVTVSAASLLANDTTEGSDALTITSVGNATGGEVGIVGSNIVFIPTDATVRTGSYEYTAGGDTTTVTITFNSGPVATATTATVAEDGTIAGNLVATDADGDSLTFALSGTGANGTATVAADGSYTFTPTADFNGEGSFSFTVTDGTADSVTSTATITVTAVNDDPVSAGATDAATEDTALNGTLAATDVDGDSLTFAVATQPTNGTVVITDTATGAYTYTPTANLNGTDTFTYTVSDGTATVTATQTVEVAATNDTPTAAATAAIAGDEDTAITGTMTASDIDAGDSVTYSITGAATNGTATVDSATGAYSYTGNQDYNGTDTFTVTATDSADATVDQVVTATVAAVNDDPTASNAAANATISVATVVDVIALSSAADVDGDTLTVTAVGQPDNGGSVELSGGTVTFTSAAGQAGTTTFTATISDGVATKTVDVVMTVAAQLGGTSGNDSLYGTTAKETLEAFGGDDTIDGGGGNDTIDAGAGDDNVTFRATELNILGGIGVDTLTIDNTVSTLTSIDLLVTTNQEVGTDVTVFGFENLDASLMSTDIDVLDAAVATTSIKTGSGADDIDVTNATGSITVDSNAGADNIQLNSAAVSVTANAGDGVDTISIENAGTTVVVNGEDGADDIDVTATATGTVTINGGAGADDINVSLVSTDSKVTVNGGEGDDVITSSTGQKDILKGDAGDDTFKYLTADLTTDDTIDGGAGTADTIETTNGMTLGDADFTNVTSVEALTSGTNAIVALVMDEKADAAGITSVTTADAQNLDVTAGFNNDLSITLTSTGAGAQSVDASASSSAVTLNAAGGFVDAADTIKGGTGSNDTINTTAVVGGTANTYDDITGIETLNLKAGATATWDTGVTLTYTAATTTALTIDASNLTDSGAVATIDVSDAEADGIYTITGGAGNDVINLGDGASTVSAGDGDDVITSDAGNGAVKGEAGDDSYKSTTAGLTAADNFDGGAGTADKIVLTDDATVIDTDFTLITNTEILTSDANIQMTATLEALAMAAGITTVTFTDTGAVDTLTVTAAFTNDLTVNATAAGANIDVITATAHTGKLTVNTTEAIATLAANSFKAGAGTTDTINLTADGGGIDAADMADVEGFEFITIANNAATGTINLHNDGIADGKTQVIDARAITGALAFTLVATNEADGILTVHGGAGVDTITASASDQGDTISTYAGNDVITMAANLNNSDTIDGGDQGAGGEDVLSATITSLTATTGKINVDNVERLNLTNNGTAVIDASLMSGTSSISLDASSDTTTLQNLSTDHSVGLGFKDLTSSAGTIGTLAISLADETGSSDAITINAYEVTSATLTATSIETATIAYSTTDAAIQNSSLTVSGLNSSKIIVTGADADVGHTLTLNTLDTETTTLDATGYKALLTVTASTSATTFDLGGTVIQTATGGAAGDTFNVASTGAIVHVLDGAGGEDTLNLDVKAGFVDAGDITNIETVNIAVASAADITIDAAQEFDSSVDDITITGGDATSTFTANTIHADIETVDASGFSGNLIADFAVSTLDSTVTVTGGALTTDAVTALYTGASPAHSLKLVDVDILNIELANHATEVVLDMAAVTGTTNINVTDVSSELLELKNLATGITVDYETTDATASTIEVKLADVTGTSDSQTFVVSAASADDGLKIVTADIETLSISSDTAAQVNLDLSGVSMTDAAKFATVSFTGANDIELTATHADVTTITASSMTTGGAIVQTARSATAASTYTGSLGDDTFIMKHADDVLDGGAGTSDTLDVDFASVGGGLIIDLTSTTDQISTLNGNTNSAIQKGFENVDASGYITAAGIDITAAAGGSTITGTGQNDILKGGAGADTLKGGAGTDTITGGDTGANSITGGDGADTMTGGSGIDTFYFTATTAADMADESGVATGADGTGDTINSYTSTTDKISFAAALLNNGTKTTTLKEIAKGGTIANNDVLVQVTDTAASDNIDTVAGATTVLTALTTSAVAIGEDLVVAMDDDTDTYLWLVTQVSTADTIAAQDITLIGVIDGVTDIADGDLTYA